MDQDQEVQAYCKALTALGIDAAVVEHPVSRDIAAVLSALGLRLSDCVPTLIMKADVQFIAVVIRGDTRIDSKRVKKFLGIRNLRMATPEEFADIIKLPLGAARVYNPGMRTVIDAKVLESEYLVGGSGRFDCSVRVKASDLTKIPNSSVADISQRIA